MNPAGGIWIQGAGEMASAVAVVLVRAGYRVVMAELPRPLAVRRLVCFCEAVYAGHATVEGIPAEMASAAGLVFRERVVGVAVDPGASALRRLAPRAVVDARLTKRPPVALPHAPAPLIGLGPGFTCGIDADLVIETHRAAGPGTVISVGGAAPDTGVPGVIAGHTTARVLRAPAAGHLRPCCVIGDLVAAGQTVGTVAGLPVISQLDGLLRGLIHEQAELYAGLKVGDVDPRGGATDPRAVTDKGRAIGDGVLRALGQLGVAAG
ncbi:MAG: EF2563 family selenium-dependent molybdenum hydroxylase system protein [bacterium]|nr:EF2563 family selenium-dependent molybdenum hydroxylase system protein [bacterium]